MMMLETPMHNAHHFSSIKVKHRVKKKKHGSLNLLMDKALNKT